MTQSQFYEFNQLHKPVSIGDIGDFGMVIFFDNGESVRVGTNYDGITYTHHSEEIETNSIQLMKDLQEMAPNFLDNMQKKYSQ